MKHETSISENLVREWGPHLELGVAVKKIEQVFISNSITGQSAIFSIFFDFSHFSVKNLPLFGSNGILVRHHDM